MYINMLTGSYNLLYQAANITANFEQQSYFQNFF